MRFIFLFSILFSLSVFSGDWQDSFEQAIGWELGDEDYCSDDDDFLVAGDGKEFSSAQLRTIKALLAVKSPFILKDLKLGSYKYYYPNTEYDIQLSFLLQDNSHFQHDYIEAKINIKPKDQHRFDAVLFNAHLEDFGPKLTNKFGRVRMISNDEFHITFTKYAATPKGTDNFFKDGLRGKLKADGKDILFLETIDKKVPTKKFLPTQLYSPNKK